MTKNIEQMKKATTKQIFDKGQILTLKSAQKLIGKKLSCTNAEYHANRPHVETFKLIGIMSEWDYSALRPYNNHPEYPQYDNFQQYWAATFDSKKIEEFKKNLILKTETGSIYKCEPNCGWYDEPTFFGSDSDRPVYYMLIV